MRRLLPALIACTLLLAAPASASASWAWPVSGDVITPYRNGADPYAAGQHRGIDIAAPVGTPVMAAAGGDVRFAGTAGSSGLTISIRTTDGYDTSYLHLSSLAVRAGARVSTGDRIGAVGITGVRSAEAPHLHFGVRDAGTRHDYHDPLAFLPAPPPSSPPEPSPPVAVRVPDPAGPVAAPVAPVVRPAPRAAPGARRAPDPGPAPRAVPAPHGSPLRAPDVRSIPAPRPVAEPHGVRFPAPAARQRPERLRRVLPSDPPVHGHARPIHHALSEQARDETGRAAHVPVGDRWIARPAVGDPAGGPDLGWVAACAGLLLAAAVLGLTGDGERAGRRGASRLSRLLPAALGRR
jgi:hypothetical protein